MILAMFPPLMSQNHAFLELEMILEIFYVNALNLPRRKLGGWRPGGRLGGSELKRVIKGHLLLVTDGARTQPRLLTSYDRIFPLPPVSFQITKTLTRPCQQPTNMVNICYNKIPAEPRDFEMCIHVV